MSFGQGRLDPRQYQNVQQPLDSATQLYQGGTDLHAQPPPTGTMMDTSRFSNFAYPYQGLPDQNSLGVGHPTDGFHTQSSMTAIDGPHSMSSLPIQNPNFGTSSLGTRSESRDGSDGAMHDKKSPMTNSFDDSVTDEFGLSSHSRTDGNDSSGKSNMDKANSIPAWSELKTKAGKERKRLPLACIACRRKKIRCSGEKPACKHCLRGRTPCVYKVTTRKAAPRTDYMAMLDKRLKRMEDRIIKVIPKSEQEPSTPTVTRAVVKPAIPGSLIGGKSAPKKRSADEAFGRDLATWASAPSKPSITSDDRPNSLQAQEAEENKLCSEGSEALPSKEIQEHLAEVFFDNIYGQAYHLLHKPSYMRKLKNNTLPPVLILSVCAVAVRFTANPKLASTTSAFLRGEEWASQAREICTRRYDWPNLTILTCLLILGLHEFGTCQGGRSWALGGQAIRMAFALQLHKDLEYDPLGRNGKKTELSFIDREIRRRIMWACFLMDRFNSSGTDRPMFIREETIKIPLPIKERYFQLDIPAPTESLDGTVLHPVSPDDGQVAEAGQNMGVAAYMIRSIAIWGRIITYLYQGGKEVDSQPIWSNESEYARLVRDAEALHCSLPTSLTYSPENIEVHKTETTASQFIFMHISIQQNILFLNRTAIMTTNLRARPGAPKEFFSQSSSKMFAAANKISDFLREAEGAGLMVSAPFAGYCAFCSTTVHILGVVSRNASVKSTAEANLGTNVKFLQKMKKYWGMFHWMVEDVRNQYRNAVDPGRAGNPANRTTADTPILQYGDWFNRYPHGLSDAEFMDPATHGKKEKGADGVLEAKPELQSVEEYISTLSPAQSAGSKEGAGAGSIKRRTTSKKQNSTNPRPGQQQQLEPIVTTNLGGRNLSDQPVIQMQQQQHQQRRPSGALVAQTPRSSNFSPATTAPQSQNPAFNNISSISPVNMTPFPQPTPTPTFFPPDLLSMNVNPQTNGILQPLDRQLVFGGYSMDGSNMGGGQNMMDGVDWNGMARTNQANSGEHSRRASVNGAINGQHQGQMLNPGTSMASFNGQEASPAWFMPFNMEPPEMTQDMGLGVNNIDVFGSMFGGSGSGMTTPNPMGGLRHRP